MPNRNYKKILGDWQVLYDNLTPRLTDMPLVAGDHANLGTMIGQARDLQNRQEGAAAQLRDLNQQRRQILNQGGDVAGRLGLALRSILGTKSEKLIEFGVKPMPRVRRKKAAKSTTPPPTSVPPPTTAPHATSGGRGAARQDPRRVSPPSRFRVALRRRDLLPAPFLCPRPPRAALPTDSATLPTDMATMPNDSATLPTDLATIAHRPGNVAYRQVNVIRPLGNVAY